jgi:hypothetical protein
MVEFARIWREMPKLVFSRTLEHVAWNSTIVRDVVADDCWKAAGRLNPDADDSIMEADGRIAWLHSTSRTSPMLSTSISAPAPGESGDRSRKR